MKTGPKAQLAICIGLAAWSNAQLSNWKSDQVNTSIFNLQGYVLSYNLSESFSKDSNVTGILLKDLMSKAIGGLQSGISSEPNYDDGAMLANDAEFFLYGGALVKIEGLYGAPAADAVLAYRRYAYGPERPLWQRGFNSGRLDDGVTRYIAYGGAVSAPSENKAWYFSGLSSPSRGPINFLIANDNSTTASNPSNTLIELDMTDQLFEKWTNVTLPDNIKPRANPEVVWVPVGKEGILVVLGGVVYPDWEFPSRKSANETESKLKSPEFMRVIDIYDIANKKWYQQPTESGPGARARGCAVVAPAADKSSFNIYYYGGYDGIHPKDDYSDEVWVLSLPSFSWTLVNKGAPFHGRSGHKCFKPYPDQMMVFGGYTPKKTSLPCLDQGPVVVFNLTSGNWLDGYSPTKYSDYGVHEKIIAAVGGTASGGATVRSPSPSGWASKELGDVFSVAYDTKKLKQYWPYGSASPPSPPPPPPGTTSPPKQPNSQPRDHLLSIILPAVIIPVLCSIGVGIALWYFCCRKKKAAAVSSTDSIADGSGLNIMTWVRGPGATKRSMMTESPQKPETDTSPDMKETSNFEPIATDKAETIVYEMEDTQVSELCDTSSPAELHGIGFTPMSSFQKQFGPYNFQRPCSQYNVQSGLGSPSAACQLSDGATEWIESPLLGTWSQFTGLEIASHPSPSDHSKKQDASAVSPEEGARPDRPLSPASTSERLGSDYFAAAAIMSPLDQTMSGETDDGRFDNQY
ncbi:Galactose oxidase/kelch, beta-propeller [Metarhizium album ARSEF 1941]|uniref:Galactose oxidase/kelch, beta-propeller n=1 Tax=Metarhizium album (strain ARSEF 1941) TaxID=1081103 RepID=A0A0B2WTQ8_METAS|nr:Galactose oxidase/kelch, beta-propeller [Metarhizium album ARSEF 1941]KHN97044.1 Galactose oxidase/kelch, beta-propeller [Metarhizium album ARSEF 1941]